jgi:hypothetical protein
MFLEVSGLEPILPSTTIRFKTTRYSSWIGSEKSIAYQITNLMKKCLKRIETTCQMEGKKYANAQR